MDRFEGPSLNQLAADGRTEEIIKAVQSGVDVTQNDNAALRFAVNGGHVSTITVLLKAGAVADKGMLSAAKNLGKIESFKRLLSVDIPCDPIEMAYAFYGLGDAELLAFLISEKAAPVFDFTDNNSELRIIDEIAQRALYEANVELFLFTIAIGAKIINPIVAFACVFSADRQPLQKVLRTANIAKTVLGLTATHFLEVENEIERNDEANCHYNYGCNAAHKVFSKWRSGEFDKMSAQELDDFDRKERQRDFPEDMF